MDLKKPMEFETTFARYTATAILGEGGAGRVYRATDESGITYAIKLLDAAGATREKLRRFKNELLFGFKNHHPYLVSVLDHGIFQSAGRNVPFYVMPHYDNSLRKLMQAGIAPNKVMRYFAQLLDGVEAAHLQKAVHRDLKPENVLHDSKSDLLVVADFGIAHFEEEELYTLVETTPHARLANFQYAAPEQRSRGLPIDQRADIYALGLMLNEMFTREIPQGTNYKTIAAVAPEYAYLDEIVARMLRQSPTSRPESIDSIKQQLIARKNEFVTQQRLSQLRRTVIPQSEADDPLILDPVRLVGVDYDRGTLILRLQQPVTQKWVDALLNIGSYSSLWRKGPERFSFERDTARIPAGEHEIQQIIDHFNNWLPKANQKYQEIITNEKRQEEEHRRQQLQAEIAEMERRQRILQNARI